jgi:hypothetical protein
MKKTLVFVLLLGLVGAFVFAQDAPALKFNGYMNFGAAITNDTVNTNVVAQGQDSGTIGRFQLQGAYTASNWGWAFKMRENANWIVGTGLTAGQPLYLSQAWGWVGILNGMVQLNAGKLADYTWSSNGWQSFGNLDGAFGVQLQLKPVAGLNLGVFLPTMLNTNTTNTASDAFGAMLIGANYTMDNMGYISLGYQLGNATNGVDPYFYAGLSYTGMSALTAVVELQLLNTSTAASNYFYIDEQLAYNMAPLNLQLYASQQLNNSAAAVSSILHFQPSVDYTMGAWNLGAFFSYSMDSNISGYAPGIWAKATVATGATVELGAEYDLGTAAQNDVARSEMHNQLVGPGGALTPQSNNLIKAYVDFVWSF